MNAVQESLLSLLLEIDEICRENDITYYIDGGTALGAVRHRGFLPWDDDADIMFTRENWERFLKAVQENPRPNRVIEGLHNCPDYTMVYARYCAVDTTCILRTSMIDQFKSGLFIDLFILDPVPDTKEKCDEYFDILYGFCEYLNPYYYDTVISSNPWYDTFREMDAKQGRDAVLQYVREKLFSNPDEEGMTYCFRYDNGRFIYPRDVVGKSVYLPFEHTRLPIAERAEDYLRIHYGDNWYMIPPVGEEEGHNVVIDLDVPYETFKNSYIGQIDREKAKKNYRNLQEVRIRQRRYTEKIDRTNYTVSAALFAKVLEKRLIREKVSVKELLAQEKLELLREILGNYYEMQLNRWFLHYHVLVPLEDEQLYGALYLLLVQGDYSKADKILKLRQEKSEAMSEDLLQIGELIDAIRNAMRAFEKEDFQRVLLLLSDKMTEHPQIALLQDLVLQAQCAVALEKEDEGTAKELLQRIGEAREKFALTDRLYAAELLLRRNFGGEQEKNEMEEALLALREVTRDGMLRLKITDTIQP